MLQQEPTLNLLFLGLRTTEDYRFYTISKAIPEFSNKGKTLVLQYTVKHPQGIDCGGGYVKLLPKGLDQTNFNGESPYKYANVLFFTSSSIVYN